MTAPEFPASVRQCGPCTLCCTVMEIEALAKPVDQACGHLSPDGGCGVYAERPQACRSFRCMWLSIAGIAENWRPDICGFLMREVGTGLIINVDPARPDAWLAEPWFTGLKQLAQLCWSNEGHVIVIARGTAIAIFPEENLLIEGWVEGAGIACGYAAQSGQMRPMYELTLPTGEVLQKMGNIYVDHRSFVTTPR